MKKSKDFFLHIVTNLALALLILSVGFVCLYPSGKEVSSQKGETGIYRKGGCSDGVSLMFNVYENTETVERILEILKVHGAKATFFVGGVWAEKNESCLKNILSDGHELGNHGYFHKDHANLSEQGNLEEISACNQLITLATGYRPVLFAPPSGAYNEHTLTVAQKLGMTTVLWSRDTVDWRDKDEKTVYTRATKNIGGGDLILMHPKEHTANALSDILNYFKTHALRAVTVTENLQIGG